MHYHRGFVGLIAVIIVATILFFGGDYYFSQQRSITQDSVTMQATTTAVTSGHATGNTIGWKTYTNTKYGFELMYPPEFLLKERETKVKNVRNEPSDSISIELGSGTTVWSLSFFNDQTAVSSQGAVNQDSMVQIIVAGKNMYRDSVPHNEGLLDGAIDFCELKKLSSEELKNVPPTFPYNAMCNGVHVVGERGFSLNYFTRATDGSISGESLQLLDAISKSLVIK